VCLYRFESRSGWDCRFAAGFDFGKSGGKASTKSTTKPAAPVTGKAPPVAAPRVEQPAIKIEPAPQSPAAVQDLDAGLKDSASADVPTIKIEEPKAEEAAK